MDSLYLQLIADEEAKVSALRGRIAECEARIRLLRSLVPRDELDDALTRMLVEARADQAKTATHSIPAADSARAYAEPDASVRASVALGEAGAPPQNIYKDPTADPEPGASARTPSSVAKAGAPRAQKIYKAPTRKLPLAALRMLSFLKEPRSRGEMDAFAESTGHRMSKSALSTFVWSYRTQYGFLDDREGKAVLTDRGRAYLDRHLPDKEAQGTIPVEPDAEAWQAPDLSLARNIAQKGGH